MARLPRICPAGIPQHIIQRGNNRQVCFGGEEDFAAYAHWLHDCSRKCRVSIHAWAFMTNHVHLLKHQKGQTPKGSDSIDPSNLRTMSWM
jgi:putative transposase